MIKAYFDTRSDPRNMNMNPLSALTGSTIDRLLDDPLTYALVLQMMEEAEAIGARLGLSTGVNVAEVKEMRKLGAIKTSMLQDMEAVRPLEIDAILGVFPELGRKLGVSTPFCDAMLGPGRVHLCREKRRWLAEAYTRRPPGCLRRSVGSHSHLLYL